MSFQTDWQWWIKECPTEYLKRYRYWAGIPLKFVSNDRILRHQWYRAYHQIKQHQMREFENTVAKVRKFIKDQEEKRKKQEKEAEERKKEEEKENEKRKEEMDQFIRIVNWVVGYHPLYDKRKEETQNGGKVIETFTPSIHTPPRIVRQTWNELKRVYRGGGEDDEEECQSTDGTSDVVVTRLTITTFPPPNSYQTIYTFHSTDLQTSQKIDFVVCVYTYGAFFARPNGRIADHREEYHTIDYVISRELYIGEAYDKACIEEASHQLSVHLCLSDLIHRIIKPYLFYFSLYRRSADTQTNTYLDCNIWRIFIPQSRSSS